MFKNHIKKNTLLYKKVIKFVKQHVATFTFNQTYHNQFFLWAFTINLKWK